MISLLLTLVSAPLVPASPLRPTGDWVVRYEHGYCSLERDFGSKERPLILVLRQIPTQSELAIYVIEKSEGSFKAEEAVSITLGGSSQYSATFKSVRLAGANLRVRRANLDNGVLRGGIGSQMLTLTAGKKVYAFVLPGMMKAVAALDECTRDLLASWGLSREVQAQTAKYPEATYYISPADYPSAALEQEASGQAFAYVQVSRDGRASNCKVALTSRNKALDKATCAALLKGRFKPAVNLAGEPIDSIVAQQIGWYIF